MDALDVMFFECPHCQGDLYIFPNEVNCGIFRHAIYKDGRQVNPHAPKNICDALVAEDKVLGCCKPFKLRKKENTEKKNTEKENTERKDIYDYEILECDYI